MPSKSTSLFSQTEDPEVKKLQLTQLLESLGQNHQLLSDSYFLAFLQVQSHVPTYKAISVENTNDFKHKTNQLIGSQISFDGKELVLIGGKDGGALSTIKSFMALNFTQEIGEIEIYKQSQNEAGQWSLSANVDVKSRIGCFSWIESARLLAIGMDCGTVSVYYLDHKVTPIKFECKLSVDAHNKPTTGIAIDLDKKVIYTTSRGSKMRIISLESGEMLNGALNLT